MKHNALVLLLWVLVALAMHVRSCFGPRFLAFFFVLGHASWPAFLRWTSLLGLLTLH